MNLRYYLLLAFLLSAFVMMPDNNPFFSELDTPHQTFPFDRLMNEHYEPAFQKGMEIHNAEVDAIINNQAPADFRNTIEALEQSGELLNNVSQVFFALESAESNDEMMEISQRLSPLLSEHSNNISLNQQLFERVRAVYNKRDSLHLNLEESKLLQDTYDGFVRRGANLNPEEKEKFRKLSSELSLISLTFGQNILKETNLFEMQLTEKKQLAGLPEDVIAAAAMEAKEKGKNGWIFTLSYPSYLPFMKYSEVRELREQLYRAYNSRCAHGGEFDNRENMKRIAALRTEIAQLLGYTNYADYVLTRRMAEDTGKVFQLLDQLCEAYKPTAVQEVKDVQDYAIASEGKNITLMPWDWSFYSEKLKKSKYDLDDELLRPYFELSKVKQGVFDLATSLYGITFQRNEKIPVYHPDVEAYDVLDKDGTFLAVLYTDFHPRKGKQNGAWMTSFRDQYRRNGVDIRPHVTIVMNFTKPTADKPSLITFDEFQTLLHEFGHALHGMFASGNYASLSGTNVYRDFVELPSQLMENFSTEKEYLDKFAQHYLTGEKIPAEYIKRIKDAAHYNAAYTCLRQLSFGYMDMAWHTLDKPYDGDVIAFERKATNKVKLLPDVDGTMFGSSFSHVFAGGYAAGYYSYKWAEVLDADAFSLFKSKGIFDRGTAEAFRREVLSKGGVEHPMTLYKRFKGEEPTIKALLLRDNILK